jgi:hypothetical protein
MNSEPIQSLVACICIDLIGEKGGELCGQLSWKCEVGSISKVALISKPDAVYVLHAFSKKTRRTSKQDIDLASDRFRAVIEERKRQKR